MDLVVFIHAAAALTAFVPFGALAFMLTFFPGGKRGCAWSAGVFFALVGVVTALLVPRMVGIGTGVGAIIGAIVGAVAGRLSTPRERR